MSDSAPLEFTQTHAHTVKGLSQHHLSLSWEIDKSEFSGSGIPKGVAKC